jgi:hypothetical protein
LLYANLGWISSVAIVRGRKKGGEKKSEDEIVCLLGWGKVLICEKV